MIKKALKSKYIRMFLAGLLVFSAIYAVCIMTIGKDAWNTLDWEEFLKEYENDECRCISLTLGKEVEVDCDVDH